MDKEIYFLFFASSVLEHIVTESNRFRELHKFLHFTNSSTLAPPGTPGYDKLGKLRPIISMIGEQIASVCDPGKEVSIDEAMIPFKVCSSLKQ